MIAWRSSAVIISRFTRRSSGSSSVSEKAGALSPMVMIGTSVINHFLLLKTPSFVVSTPVCGRIEFLSLRAELKLN